MYRLALLLLNSVKEESVRIRAVCLIKKLF
nr:MAG TPA: hypothetical protein [Caudoviricetes sp.]